MKRTNETFKNEVFRRYQIAAKNRRNLRIYITSTLTLFLLVGAFAIPVVNGSNLFGMVASFLNLPDEESSVNSLANYLDESVESMTLINVGRGGEHYCTYSETQDTIQLLTKLTITPIDGNPPASGLYYRIRAKLTPAADGSLRELIMVFCEDGVMKVSRVQQNAIPTHYEYFQIAASDYSALLDYFADMVGEPVPVTMPPEDLNSPQLSVQTYDALTDVYGEKPVKKVKYLHSEFSPTYFETSDSAHITTLMTILEKIPAETFTDECACGATEYPVVDDMILLEFAGGGYCLFYVNTAEHHLYYEIGAKYQPFVEPTEPVSQWSYLKISDSHLAELANHLQTMCKTLAPLTKAPSPDEYFSKTFENVELNSKTMTGTRGELLQKELKKALTGLPLIFEKSTGNTKALHTLYFTSADYSSQIYIAICSQRIILEFITPQHTNFYVLQISEIHANELSMWLSEFSVPDRTPDLPSLEYYLTTATFSRISCYESCESQTAFFATTLISQQVLVEASVNKLNALDWKLVSEDIAPQTSKSNGIMIEYTMGNMINAYSFILEFDISGRVLCKIKPLHSIDSVSLYEATYTLTPEEVAAFTAYIYTLPNTPTN